MYLFKDIYPSANYNEWQPAFRLTRRCLVYGRTTNLVSVKTNKQQNQCSAAREQV